MHFQNVLSGFTPEDEAQLVDWPLNYAKTQGRPEDTSAGSSSKGKERLQGPGHNVVSPAGKSAVLNSNHVERSDRQDTAGAGTSTQKKRKGPRGS